MNLKKISAALLILLPALLYGSAPGPVEFNTRHFVISCSSDLCTAAVNIACRAEECFTALADFMEYEPPGRTVLRIVAPGGGGGSFDGFLSLFSPGTIEVEATGSPESEADLSGKVCDRYMSLYRESYGLRLPYQVRMIQGLMDYIIKGIDAESVMLLNDYVLNQGKGEIKIDGKRAGQTGLPDFIYRFFWHFVCRNYGKNSAAQSLKDSVYYGGFFNSLYTVSGKDASAVDLDFNLFLGRYLKKTGIDPCYSAAGPGGMRSLRRCGARVSCSASTSRSRASTPGSSSTPIATRASARPSPRPRRE